MDPTVSLASIILPDGGPDVSDVSVDLRYYDLLLTLPIGRFCCWRFGSTVVTWMHKFRMTSYKLDTLDNQHHQQPQLTAIFMITP